MPLKQVSRSVFGGIGKPGRTGHGDVQGDVGLGASRDLGSIFCLTSN